MNIRFITTTDTLPLRQRILRPGRSISECHFPGDEAETSFHLGGFAGGEGDGDHLVCIASVMQQPEERFGLFDSRLSFQLRGMATDEAFRGQRYGVAVLRACIEQCRSRDADLLWCNARVAATGFYQKQGFLSHPDVFDIPDVGPHQVMFLLLS